MVSGGIPPLEVSDAAVWFLPLTSVQNAVKSTRPVRVLQGRRRSKILLEELTTCFHELIENNRVAIPGRIFRAASRPAVTRLLRDRTQKEAHRLALLVTSLRAGMRFLNAGTTKDCSGVGRLNDVRAACVCWLCSN